MDPPCCIVDLRAVPILVGCNFEGLISQEWDIFLSITFNKT